MLPIICKYNYSKIASAKQQREKEKDPHYRYQQFVRNASKAPAVSHQPSASGSFGGKPKTFQGRRGVKRTVATTVPAWLAPGDEEK